MRLATQQSLHMSNQIGDQDIARGNPPLVVRELHGICCCRRVLLYDKKITLPGKQKRAVYTTTVETDPYTYHDG